MRVINSNIHHNSLESETLVPNKTRLKIRLLWLLYLLLLFITLYGSVNQYISLGTPPNSFVFEWEKHIPFIEEFIIPYIALYPMVLLTFLLPQSNLELRVLLLRSFVIIFFSITMFLLFPLQFSFEKPQVENFSWFITVVEMVDYPYNQAPSLHVSFSVLLGVTLAKRVHSWWINSLLTLWFVTIALSTLFVYQHHFIDVITGALVGFLSCYFIDSSYKIGFLKGLTEAKDLKIALFYLMGSLFAVVLCFHVSVWFVWVFFYFFVVSLFYALRIRLNS